MEVGVGNFIVCFLCKFFFVHRVQSGFILFFFFMHRVVQDLYGSCTAQFFFLVQGLLASGFPIHRSSNDMKLSIPYNQVFQSSRISRVKEPIFRLVLLTSCILMYEFESPSHKQNRLTLVLIQT